MHVTTSATAVALLRSYVAKSANDVVAKATPAIQSTIPVVASTSHAFPRTSNGVAPTSPSVTTRRRKTHDVARCADSGRAAVEARLRGHAASRRGRPGRACIGIRIVHLVATLPEVVDRLRQAVAGPAVAAVSIGACSTIDGPAAPVRERTARDGA